MEKEFTTSKEQTESTEQLKKKYENIQPLDMWPANEVIGKNRLDEIFDTFDDNSSVPLTQEDKKEIETLITQLTEWKTDKNNILLNITTYIKELWSEITKEDLIDNIQERFVKTEKLTTNTAETSRQENIQSLISSLNTLLPADNSKPYKGLLDRLQTIDPNNPWKEFDEILSQLNNQETLISLTLDIQAKDRQNGTHNFDAFKSAVINLDPSFKDKFRQAEINAKLALWTDTLQNTKITDRGYKQTGNDGFTTSATLDGQDRSISRTDSDYSLKSDIDSTTAQKEAEKLSNDLAENLKPINKDLASINTMKTHIDEAQRQGTDLDTLKTELQAIDPELYDKLGLVWLNSPDEILNTLTTQETELIAKRDELQANADKAREKLVYDQKAKAEQKDHLKKETLNFIHEIGFDSIPQATTDTIIANINQAPMTHWITQKIDIPNGCLGFDTDFWNKEISLGEKQKFAELYNKALTWSKEYPIKLVNGKVTFYDSLQNAQAGIPAGFAFNIKEFVNKNLWPAPVIKAMENLGKGDNQMS